ncbi:MAG: hypothetical protein JXR16_09365 [Bermanella sp.]
MILAIVSTIAFLLISMLSVFASGASLKVHAVNIFSLAIALPITTLISSKAKSSQQIFIILFIGSLLSIIAIDYLSSVVIVKRTMFMGWYVMYPIGLLILISINAARIYVSSKLPYNKARQKRPAGWTR